MTIAQKIDVLQEMSQAVAALAVSLRADSYKMTIPAELLNIKQSLGDSADALDFITDTISDLIETERMDMEKKHTQLTERLAAAKGNSPQQRETPDPRSTETALDEIEKQMLAEGEIVERVSCMLAKLETKIMHRLDLIEQQVNATGERVVLTQQKFTGIGNALDVIAKATQKPAAGSGNNGDEPG